MAANISNTRYSIKRKQLLALVNELQNAGAQDDLDLPRITVIGNQSAGKSSVVESISGITVPRDAGTCTRCPIECRMVNSTAAWSCDISIRREPNEKNGLSQPVIIKFGDTIYDKTCVESALRRAQVAALDPMLDINKIKSCSDEELKEHVTAAVQKTPFTKDIVCLDLRGPECVDLAFIDLPGLIQNAEPNIVKDVEDIVTSHIKGRCLILVAIPMTDDIENQSAFRLARRVDPDNERTMGVLTKPDMLTSGNTHALENWVRVLGGTQHSLVHGYFCTRQLNDEERAQLASNPTATKAREIEETFFSETRPWNIVSCQGRLGVGNLIHNLSEILVNLIQESLPKIMTLAQDQLVHCGRSLDGLPPSLLRDGEEPSACILRLITGYSACISECVRGDVLLDISTASAGSSVGPSSATPRSRNAQLIQRNRAAYQQLKNQIRSTAPQFVPWEEGGSEKKSEIRGSESSDKAAEDFTLTKMREYIKGSITRELPNNIPFSAKAKLIDSFQAAWPEHTFACLDQVKYDMLTLLHERVEVAFGTHKLLKMVISSHVTELVKTHLDVCHTVLRMELKKERIPFTQNTHYLESVTEKWLARYKETRRGTPSFPPAEASAVPRGPPVTERSPRFVPQKPKAFSRPTPGNRHPLLSWSDHGCGRHDRKTGVDTMFPHQEGQIFLSFDEHRVQDYITTAETSSDIGEADSASVILPDMIANNEEASLVREVLAGLAKLGYSGVTAEDLAKLNPVNDFETELRVMAEVRGYFQVAYKRIIDNVPNAIDLTFVRAISEELQSFLIGKFGLGTEGANEICKEYLADDPLVAEKRKQLLAKKTRLEIVLQKLEAFGIHKT